MIDSSKALPVGSVLRSNSRAYTIVEVLGQGGFGITYRATAVVTVDNIDAEAQFAIKEHFVASYCERDGVTKAVSYSRPVANEVENSRKDFLSEARRLRDLSKGAKRHPNIVCVNETFETNNTAYFVMEYLKGETLSSYVKRHGPLSDNEMRDVMIPIIDAVAFLHREYITHLDIKPANIMLTRDKAGKLRPVLIDFGLSRHFDPKSGAPSSSIQQAGFSEGYAPIEQVEAFKHFFPGTDVYSLGATMLFALTGRTPASAANIDNETLRNAIPAGLPASTVETITKSMRYVRKERPENAAALLAILANGDNTRKIDNDPINPEIYTEPIRKTTAKETFKKTKSRLAPKPKQTLNPNTKPKSKKSLYIGIGVVALFILLCVGWWYNTKSRIVISTQKKNLALAGVHAVELDRTPNHLDLAVKYNGEIGYFTSDEWQSLSSDDQAMYQKIGMYIDADKDFIIELKNKDGGREMDWNEAMDKYGSVMPTKAQGEILLSIGWNTWKSKMNAYCGDAIETDCFWTNEEYSYFSWFVIMPYGPMNYDGKPSTAKIRAVASFDNSYASTTTEQGKVFVPTYHSTPGHLDLAVEYNGERGYFSSEEWTSLSSDAQSRYSKIGMVVSAEGQRFIIELHNTANGRVMDWAEAKEYIDVMPTKAQGEALASIGWDTWESKMNAYDGGVAQWIWIKGKDDSYGRWLDMGNGFINRDYGKDVSRVCAVVPLI